jgi:hypothetical protein
MGKNLLRREIDRGRFISEARRRAATHTSSDSVYLVTSIGAEDEPEAGWENFFVLSLCEKFLFVVVCRCGILSAASLSSSSGAGEAVSREP